MTNIEDLRVRLKVLLDLLAHPEPGLFAWRESYEHAAANVLTFWGYGQTASLLPSTPAPASASAGVSDELWRKLLWSNHARYLPFEHTPYGDDGEMQCCGIDFKRNSPQEIEDLLVKRSLAYNMQQKRHAAAPATASASAGVSQQEALKHAEKLFDLARKEAAEFGSFRERLTNYVASALLHAAPASAAGVLSEDELEELLLRAYKGCKHDEYHVCSSCVHEEFEKLRAARPVAEEGGKS